MTDLEMTELCAEAMGIDWAEELQKRERLDGARRNGYISEYNPLKDGAQAMDLVKNFGMNIYRFSIHRVGVDQMMWQAVLDDYGAQGGDLNRAIVECVARMQSERSTKYQNGQPLDNTTAK